MTDTSVFPRAVLAGVAVVAMTVTAVAGFVLGQGGAADDSDAAAARSETRDEAARVAERRAFAKSSSRGAETGRAAGRRLGERDGHQAGLSAGESESNKELAAIEAEEAQEASAGLQYVDQLPHGEPGYVLPPEERSLSCVGFDAETGQCIGD